MVYTNINPLAIYKHETGSIVKRSSKSRKVEYFAATISIPTSSYYNNKPRIARCRVCDKVAHYRVVWDMDTISKIEYYCKACVNGLDS
jgi:hypothetical protein